MHLIKVHLIKRVLDQRCALVGIIYVFAGKLDTRGERSDREKEMSTNVPCNRTSFTICYVFLDCIHAASIARVAQNPTQNLWANKRHPNRPRANKAQTKRKSASRGGRGRPKGIQEEPSRAQKNLHIHTYSLCTYIYIYIYVCTGT